MGSWYSPRTWFDQPTAHPAVRATDMNRVERALAILARRAPNPPTTVAGQWVLPRTDLVAGTAQPGVGTARATPIFIAETTKIDALSVAVTVAGAAGSLMRLGIYSDDGTGYPGALLASSGALAVDVTGAVVGTFAAVTLQPGPYWRVAALTTSTSQPTIATLSAANAPLDFRVGTAPPGAGSVLGWSQGGITAALPATFAAGGSLIGTAPRVAYRVA